MKQLVQNLRDGHFAFVESPSPFRPPGFVLVETRASVISAGTERGTVLAARASLLGKARQRPDKVRQVLENLKREGFIATLKKVQEKLDQPKPLGYSSSGVVLECDAGEERFRVGDRVACGGGDYATHSEQVVVPRNLVCALPSEVTFEQGAYATIGAIALQGLRRARVTFGENVLVVGLGLLGQITWQLARSAGCNVIGFDIAESPVLSARRLGLESAISGNPDEAISACKELTGGRGIDATLIAADAKDSAPLVLAGSVARERGRVVVVGRVPGEPPRDLYYAKELDLLISRSYGPGRYDAEYEEGGVDYPYGLVRWTEGRNIEAVVHAISKNLVSVDALTTHRFKFEQAEQAYSVITGREPSVGVVLEYPGCPTIEPMVSVSGQRKRSVPNGVSVAFIGAGSFARGYLLPILKARSDVDLYSVTTGRGFTANDAARKFGFRAICTDASVACSQPESQAVFIATRHDSHAALAIRALRHNKHVFVEKPLAINPSELRDVVSAARESGGILQVGFNRRFSPMAERIRRVLASGHGPCQITYRVNAGPLPASHWLLDPDLGGGRIVGEACHFIDVIQFLTDEIVVSVCAFAAGTEADGSTSIILDLSGGSTAALVYQANATLRIRKERLEAFRGGRGGVIDDWRDVEIHDGNGTTRHSCRHQEKGYGEELAAFFDSLRTGVPAIPVSSLALTTAATFAVLQSVRERRRVEVRFEEPSS